MQQIPGPPALSSVIGSGDFNGDGNLDIVGAVLYRKGVFLLLGKGDGTFDDPISYPTGYPIDYMAVGDLNKDGYDDVVLSNSGSDDSSYPPPPPRSLQVYLGSVSGTLAAGFFPGISGTPRGIALGDLNGDGTLDLVAEIIGSGFMVFPGRGDGTFDAPHEVLHSVLRTGGILLGDLNGDQRLDLVTPDFTALGTGDGKFDSPQPISLGPTTYWDHQVLSDLNGDGILDLVGTSTEPSWTRPESGFSQSTVLVLAGRADGTFLPPDIYRSIPGEYPWQLTPADLTGDGVLDLVIATYYDTGGFSVLVGKGNGKFGMRQDVTFDGGGFIGFVAADLNHDGRIDLAGSVQRGATWFFSLLNQSFTPTPDHPPVLLVPSDLDVTPYHPVSLEVRALDPDSDPIDVMAAKLVKLPPRSTASFTSEPQPDQGELSWTPRAIDAGDYTVSFRASNALAATASVHIHVAPPSGPPAGEGFESFFQAIHLSGQPDDAIAADLNGDGLPDLAATSGQARTIWIILQRSDHSFGIPTSYPLEEGAYTLDSGDLNGDGKPDLVLGIGTPLKIRTMLNRGDGSFDPPTAALVVSTEYPSFSGRRFALLDVNRDQKVDLVNFADHGRLHVHFGVGDGTFEALPGIDLAESGNSLLARDVNGDGLHDLLILSFNSVIVFLQRQQGGLFFASSFSIPNQSTTIAVGDVDGDGHVDLVGAPRFQGNLTLFRGLGDGTFELAGTRPSNVYSLALGDYVEDGNDDPVLSNPEAGRIDVVPWVEQIVHSTPSARYTDLFLPVEMNGDGHLDLVTLASSGLAVYSGNGDGTFGTGRWLETEGPIGNFVLARIDGDQHQDLAIARQGYGATQPGLIELGDGKGGFQPGEAWDDSMAYGAIASGDVNGDGHTDLVLSGGILLGNGDGTFQSLRPFDFSSLPPYSSLYPDGIELADFNQDGRMDLVISSFPGDDGVWMFLGRGDGTFEAPVQVFETCNSPDVAVGDMNGDHVPDLVVANGCGASGSGDGYRVYVFLNDGHAHFTPTGTEYATPRGIRDLHLADLDRDGALDLVLLGSQFVSTLKGRGDGSLLPPQNYEGAYAGTMAIDDLDGDGYLDLVTTDGSLGNVSVLLGSATGAFSRRRDFGAGSSPGPLAIGDIDGNGLPDIVVGNEGSTYVSVLRNLGAAISSTITAEVTVQPHNLSLHGQGGSITADIELPVGNDPLLIDPASLRLGGASVSRLEAKTLADHDGDGLKELVVHFDRSGLGDLASGDQLLTLTGNLLTGVSFKGSASVHVTNSDLTVRVKPGSGGGVTITSTAVPGVEEHVRIFDLQGRIVREWSAVSQTDTFEASWDDCRQDGHRCSSGVYFIRVDAGKNLSGVAKAVITR